MMANVIGRVIIDFNKDDMMLFDSGRIKSARVVAGYVERNLMGERPPVFGVVRSKEGVYELYFPDVESSSGEDYGGHKRSIAHYISRTPLECLLYDGHGASFWPSPYYSIKKVRLKLEEGQEAENFLGDAPEEVRQRFISMCIRHSPFGIRAFFDKIRGRR